MEMKDSSASVELQIAVVTGVTKRVAALTDVAKTTGL